MGRRTFLNGNRLCTPIEPTRIGVHLRASAVSNSQHCELGGHQVDLERTGIGSPYPGTESAPGLLPALRFTVCHEFS